MAATFAPRTASSLITGLAFVVWMLGGAHYRADAQPYPSGPVKLIVTTGTGAGPDVIARILADHLSRIWGQQVFVANHPAAAGALGMKIAGAGQDDRG